MREIALQDLPEETGNTLYRPGKIDVNKAIELRCRGLTFQEISVHFNCTKQAVSQLIKNVIPDNIHLESYQNNKANLIDFKAAEILSGLTQAKLKKESYRSLVQSMKDLNEMARLERSQATSITESRVFNATADVSKLFI